jgi:uncharacterized protein
MRALVTGATGFIGRKLVRLLKRPVVLSRRPEAAGKLLGDVQVFAWEPESGPPPPESLEGVEAVFNFAGESVAAGRWTDTRKKRIRSSRVVGTRNLVAAIEGMKIRPKVLVSASAVGYYGSRGDEVLEESAPHGNDFLASVCREWEAEAQCAAHWGIRVSTPRIGIVLGKGGGALERMLPPFKLGLGGRLGSGRHWMPWIHLDDLAGLLLHAAKYGLSGPLNAVGPAPVTNLQFTRALARALGRPAIFPVPEFALRLIFGELAGVLLASQRVVPHAAVRAGYRFRYGSLDDALSEIIGKGEN